MWVENISRAHGFNYLLLFTVRRYTTLSYLQEHIVIVELLPIILYLSAEDTTIHEYCHVDKLCSKSVT